MTRMLTTAAVIALSISGAQAGPAEPPLPSIHNRAVAACAPERAPGELPRSHYVAAYDHCVYRISRSAMTQYQAIAQAEAEAKAAQRTQLASITP